MKCLHKFVHECFAQLDPPTYSQLIDFVQGTTEKVLIPDTMRKLIARFDDLKTVVGVPMEAERVKCNEADAELFYELLKDAVNGIPAAFIFNLDEAGFQEWVDAREEKVVVPECYEGDDIKIPTDGNSKRSTLLACISAEGDALKPLLIVPRKTIETEQYECGYTKKKALIVSQPNGLSRRR